MSDKSARPGERGSEASPTQVSPTADTHVASPSKLDVSKLDVSPTADTQIAGPGSTPPAPLQKALAGGAIHSQEAATLDAPPVTPGPQPSGPDLLSPMSDAERYVLAGEIARGGLGRILKARDLRLRRNVALKELLSPGGGAESRFLREALITARLQHPAIIPLYDAGRSANGEAFYSMKLVSGQSLEEAIAAKRTLTDRLSLLPHVIHVADAIAYAHSKRVIHRDLKPQNVLVGEFGETVVIDWGIAKDLAQSGADSGSTAAAASAWAGAGSSDLTIDGTIMGTPAYMPPEQARGEPVDERADVYALGAILYHLMAGAPPYDEDLREILKKLLARPPVPPPALSDRIRGVPNDLQAIVTKAMAPSPEHRYPSAKELAADLQKFQTGQIVGAYHYTTGELVRRWLRKNKLVASLVAFITVGGVASVAQIVEKSRAAEEGRRVAVAAQSKAEAAEERERRRADEVTLEQARLSLGHDPQRSLDFLAALSPEFPRMSAARVIAADALSRTLPLTLRGHKAGVFGARFSPDGKKVVSCSYDKTVRVWDLETGQGRSLEGHTAEVGFALFSPDGTKIASASYDHTARLWDVATGRSVTLEGHKDWLRNLAFSESGDRLFTSSADGASRVWDLRATPLAARVFESDGEERIWEDVSADAGRILTTAMDGTLRLFDVATGESRVIGKGDATTGEPAELSPDGTLAARRERAHVTLYDLTTGRERKLDLENNAPRSVEFSQDSKRLAVTMNDSSVRVVDAASARTLRVLRGHEGEIRDCEFSPDGERLVSGGDDLTVRVWSVATGDAQVFRAHSDQVSRVAFSRDGERVVSASLDGTVRVWTPRSAQDVFGPFSASTTDALFLDEGRVAVAEYAPDVHLCSLATRACETLSGHRMPVNHIALSPDHKLLASASADGTVRLWDVTAGARLVRALDAGSEVRDAVFLPDGKSLVSFGADKTLRRWDLATGEGRVVGTHPDTCYRLVASRARAVVGAMCLDNSAHVFDLDAGTSRVLTGHESRVLDLTFAPDGEHAATASLDRTARLWDLTTGQARVLASSDGGLYTAAFSPDGALLATGSDAGVLRVWDLATGESRALHGHEGAIRYAVFSPDGRTIATASRDYTARLWDVATGESRALRGHTDSLRKVAFAPSGQRVVTTAEDGSLRLYVDDLPRDEAALRARLSALALPSPPK